MLALGLTLGEVELDGDVEADGLMDGETELEGETDADGLTDGLADEEGETDGETDDDPAEACASGCLMIGLKGCPRPNLAIQLGHHLRA